MDLPTLFFLDREVGIHDIGCGIRLLVALVGTLLFDGASWPVREIGCGPPEWQV